MYEELVMNRIIIRPPKVALNDFIGDFNYLPSLIRQAKHEPMPTMYDVKQLTALYGILPFGLFEKKNSNKIRITLRIII